MEGYWDKPIVAIHMKARWSKFKPGTIYRLGEYEQTAIYDEEIFVGWQTEPIEWIPVDKIDGKYLLVSKDSIDYLQLDSEKKFIPWADTDLRRWLNDEFYNKVFTEEEKAILCDFTDPELGTTDKVFLLSLSEAKLIYDLEKFVDGTDYARSKGLEDFFNSGDTTLSSGEYYIFYPWLTRSFRDGKNWSTGAAERGGKASKYAGLRPAILVDPEKLKAR